MRHGRPFMVGITGASCSGKTTLERSLTEWYGDNISILSFDDMFVGPEVTYSREIEDWEDADLYRWDDYQRHLLELRAGRPASIMARSRESMMSGISHKEILPSKVVASAGFLVLHKPEVAALFDLKVFVDVSEEEIINRRYQRTVEETGLGEYDPMQYIVEYVIPGHRRLVVPQREVADEIIDGMADAAEVARDVINLVEQYSSDT